MNLFDPHFLETFDTILMLMNGIGHYREVGKYGSFLSKDETTASPRGMYLDGFQ